MKMHDPPDPGEVLRQLCVEPPEERWNVGH